jgi:1,2-diacylglycerol 3-alpha-glucosyltransferase
MTYMKIAYFTDSFYPLVNGVATYIGSVTRALIASGHEVMIIAPKLKNVSMKEVERFVPGARIVLVPGVKLFFYPDMKIGTPTPLSFVEVRKFQPDVIHFHTPSFMGFEATVLAKMLKVPLLATFHTYYMEPETFAAIGLKEHGSLSKMLQESLWQVSKTIHNPCDAIVAPTKYVGNDLRKRWKGKKIEVIAGAVDLKPFTNRSSRSSLRKHYGLDKAVVFLSVGRLSAEKHYDVLITAFSMLLMKYPKARLVFVGDGPAREELEYIVKVLGISSAVVFTGAIPYATLTLKNYYSMGDVFVTPSTWDTQGLSTVEAMASKLPVVAFNYRVMPEVIGKGGILVKHLDQYGFAQAMGELAGNADLRSKVGSLALLRSKNYQIGVHTNNLIGLYQRLCDNFLVE